MPDNSDPAAVKKCCLVVDDDEEVREQLASFIEKNGFKVLEAKGGYEAIDLYTKHGPDLVFLDVMLPDIDGISVLKEIKKFHPEARVYLFTGVDGYTFRAEAIKYGASGHLVKPVQIKDILKALKEV